MMCRTRLTTLLVDLRNQGDETPWVIPRSWWIDVAHVLGAARPLLQRGVAVQAAMGGEVVFAFEVGRQESVEGVETGAVGRRSARPCAAATRLTQKGVYHTTAVQRSLSESRRRLRRPCCRGQRRRLDTPLTRSYHLDPRTQQRGATDDDCPLTRYMLNPARHTMARRR